MSTRFVSRTYQRLAPCSQHAASKSSHQPSDKAVRAFSRAGLFVMSPNCRQRIGMVSSAFTWLMRMPIASSAVCNWAPQWPKPFAEADAQTPKSKASALENKAPWPWGLGMMRHAMSQLHRSEVIGWIPMDSHMAGNVNFIGFYIYIYICIYMTIVIYNYCGFSLWNICWNHLRFGIRASQSHLDVANNWIFQPSGWKDWGFAGCFQPFISCYICWWANFSGPFLFWWKTTS